MILSFCTKNKLWDRENIDFVYPNEDEIIRSYSGIEFFDRPFIGDTVILRGELYKVFNTIVDYDQKELYAIVEKL